LRPKHESAAAIHQSLGRLIKGPGDMSGRKAVHEEYQKAADEVLRLKTINERHERRFREAEAEWVERFELLEAEIERLRARLDAAERLIEVVRARDIGTAGGVGAAFEAYDSIRHNQIG